MDAAVGRVTYVVLHRGRGWQKRTEVSARNDLEALRITSEWLSERDRKTLRSSRAFLPKRRVANGH
jgi:hypothetical protein